MAKYFEEVLDWNVLLAVHMGKEKVLHFNFHGSWHTKNAKMNTPFKLLTIWLRNLSIMFDFAF